MRILLLVLAFICVAAWTGLVQAAVAPLGTLVHTPVPPYPVAAREAKITGAGVCEVSFDAAGHADKAVMTRSTGSSILDENTLSYARQHWTGNPKSRLDVPIAYQLAKPFIIRVSVSRPPYPYEARVKHLQGSGSISVTFDENGKAAGAIVAKSTGSSILDDNSVRYALARWKSSGGKTTTVVVPVTYRLSH